MPATPTQADPASGAAVTDPSVAQLRHRREVPMLVMGGTLSALGVLLFIGLVAAGQDVPGWLSGAVLALLVGPVLLAVVFIRYNYWQTVANGAEVTADSFPEVYEIYHDNAQRMGLTDPAGGMDGLPRLYVVNGNGLHNAYATKCQVAQAYVVIYSDLVDIAYEHGDFATVRFALAHELGHVKCRHVSIWRTLLHPVASRACCSCSRASAAPRSTPPTGSPATTHPKAPWDWRCSLPANGCIATSTWTPTSDPSSHTRTASGSS
jgi:hypothetical protein